MTNIHIDCTLGFSSKTGIGYVTRLLIYTYLKLGFNCDVYINKSEMEIKEYLHDYMINLFPTKSNLGKLNFYESRFKPFNFLSKYIFNTKTPKVIFCPHQYPSRINKEMRNNSQINFIVHDLCYLLENYYDDYLGFLKVIFLNKRIEKYSLQKNCTIYCPRISTIEKIKNKILKGKEYKCNFETFPIPYFFGHNSYLDRDNKLQSNKYILTISNIRGNKGIKTYLELVNQSPNLNFIFVGNIDEYKLYKKHQNLKILKNLSDNDLFALLLNCKVLLSTSRCEGLCLPVCRANALKIPTACFKLDIYNNDEFKFLHFIDTKNLSLTSEWLQSKYINDDSKKILNAKDLEIIDHNKFKSLEEILRKT